jgi:hypothetical protein
LTEKDRRDLAAALEAEADWIALSFIQRPEDVAEVRKIARGRSGILSKIEKPQAVERSKRSSSFPTPSWSLVAIWAWRCLWPHCRARRSASPALLAVPASQWLWPRRCWNR